MKSQLVNFDMVSGLAPDVKPIQRRLSQMKDMFAEEKTRTAMQAKEDALVYEFYDMHVPEKAVEVAYGTSITYPGKVGSEYFMTKGHFHTILDAAEVYFCIRGHGYMLMESPEGAVEAQEMKAGGAVYVPGRYAHRSVNVSATEPLITFFAFRADAGHDYGTIESKGFRRLIVEKNGRPDVVDNPRWK